MGIHAVTVEGPVVNSSTPRVCFLRIVRTASQNAETWTTSEGDTPECHRRVARAACGAWEVQADAI